MKQRPGRAKQWKAGFGLLALGALTLFIGTARSPLAQSPSQSSKPADSPATGATSSDANKAEQAPQSASQSTPPAPPLDPAQAQLAADSQKLLKLSQELKDEVAKTNKDTLSIAVIKKADEVEK